MSRATDYTNAAQQRLLQLVDLLAGHELNGLAPAGLPRASFGAHGRSPPVGWNCMRAAMRCSIRRWRRTATWSAPDCGPPTRPGASRSSWGWPA